MNKILLATFVASAVTVGCNGPGVDNALKTPEMANPAGKPRNDQEAKQATLQQQAGESARDRMARDGKAMKDAQQRSGGN